MESRRKVEWGIQGAGGGQGGTEGEPGLTSASIVLAPAPDSDSHSVCKQQQQQRRQQHNNLPNMAAFEALVQISWL